VKKILIIGASILQLPAIIKAKELGYYVGVVDYNPNAVGIAYADKYFNVSTIDEDGIVNVAKEFVPDGIMTLATDMPMRAVAKVCDVCGLPGITYGTALKATDKGEMIKAFEENAVEHPWYYIIKSFGDLSDVIDSVSYPCIMKPTDNAGSRGVVLCQNRAELEENYEYSHTESRGGNVIIEEYLKGPEFSVEVMVIDGKPNVLQITDKLTTGAPHFVEMGHSQPTIQSEEMKKKIIDLACRACRAVGINVGPAHVEMILTNEGPKMVELGARMGGDCITTHLVPLSTGIDMVARTIKLVCGEKINVEKEFNKGSAIRYFVTKPGVIKNIENVEEARNIEGVKELSLVYNIGDRVEEIGSSTDRVGFVIAQAETANDAIKICNKAIETVRFSMEE